MTQRPGRVPLLARITRGPNQLGFDYFYGFTHARNIGTIIEQDRVVEHVAAVENQPRMIAKAVAWLERRQADKPFFLYFPMCPPHTPVVPAPDFVGASGAVDEVGHNPRYVDWLYQGDQMLGQLLDALDRNGLAGCAAARGLRRDVARPVRDRPGPASDQAAATRIPKHLR